MRVLICKYVCVFFCKQKTAYERRISDWSSDVCSSDLHVDLHLTNIAMIDGEAVPFDCLEFSPDLATVDVLYDLGFLLMDLWHYGYRKEANLVFNRYFDLSQEDEPGLPLLPLFLSMRAAVLTHVLALQAPGAGNKELADPAQADRKGVGWG